MKPPHIKAQRYKNYRKNVKRQRQLFDAKRKLGYIKLEEPIRHGWFKVIEIAPSVERYKHAEAIKEVLKKIKTSYWGATKEKAQLCWDQERSRYMLSRDKPTISSKSYNKLSRKAKDLCVFFRYKEEGSRKYKGRFYVNFPPGSIEIRYRKSYITHRKRIDPLIESELDFLESELMKPGYFEILCGGYWNHYDRMSKSFERKVEAHRVKESLSLYRNIVISEELKEEISWEIN